VNHIKAGMVAAIATIFSLGCTSSLAASFSLNGGGKTSQEQPQKDAAAPITKTLTATGYGIDEEQATKMAFRAAIEQYIGVVVDSNSIVKNNELIEDNLLTASSGYIQTFKVISSKNVEGLVQVKILATVESQKLIQSIKKLNIATIKVTGDQSMEARVETKQIAKEDALKMLHKAWDKAWSDEAVLSMLTVKIDDVKVKEEKVNVENHTVPVEVQATISINLLKYQATIQKLETLFKQLGAKLHKRYDLPTQRQLRGSYIYISSSKYTSYNMNNLSSGIYFMKHYGRGLSIDLWEFPKDWQVKLQMPKYQMSEDFFQVPVEIKDASNNVLAAQYIKLTSYDRLFDSLVPAPFFCSLQSPQECSAINTLADEISVNLSDVKKIVSVTVELEKK